MFQPLSFRSYGPDGSLHHHDHVQVVLPVAGCMEIEIEGRGARLEADRAAFIAPGMDHAQAATEANRFLILDCPLADIGADAAEHLHRLTFLPVSAAVRRLIEFADISRTDDGLPDALARHCAPLLLLALLDLPKQASPLGPLIRRVEAAPGEDWPVERMAREAGLAASRLHALFRADLGMTPQQWLSGLRLKAVREALAGSDRPISQIAFEAGYSDQSALTRAMRRSLGLTPAAYRRQHRS